MHHKLFSREERQWLIVFCWLVAVVLCIVYLPHAGKPFKIENLSDPAAESTIAQQTMRKEFPYSGSRVVMLFKSNSQSAYSAGFKSQVNKSLA